VRLGRRRSRIVGHVPDSGDLLIHRLHIFGANRHKGIHSKSGMAVYQGGVVTGGICIVIILSCVTNGRAAGGRVAARVWVYSLEVIGGRCIGKVQLRGRVVCSAAMMW